jgi:hypothetical protein
VLWLWRRLLNLLVEGSIPSGLTKSCIYERPVRRILGRPTDKKSVGSGFDSICLSTTNT